MASFDIVIQFVNGGFKIPDKHRERYEQYIKWSVKNRNGNSRLILKPPYKPRSTGEGSQSHHINGHVTQIANEIGDTFDDIKDEAKRRAISKGYPYRTDSFKNVKPLSETEIDTTQAGYLIEALHEIAAFLNVTLTESNNG